MAPLTHRVTARNAATASANRIHDDAVARQYGFRGGLVPGVTLYGYMTRPVVSHFGTDWLGRGTLSVRFNEPVYDGEEVTVTAEPDAGDPAGLSVVLRNPDGAACATGRATLPPRPGSAPDGHEFPVVQAPAAPDRPPADEVSLAPGTALATVWSGVDLDHASPFLALLADDQAVYAEEGLAHPGWLILAANAVLTSSVVLGPWVHVGSDVTNFRTVPDGAVVETRARVAERFERRGHHFVVLDVVWLVDEVVAMSATHTAIYRLRG